MIAGTILKKLLFLLGAAGLPLLFYGAHVAKTGKRGEVAFPLLAPSARVGYLPGELSVSGAGNAGYRLDITAPAGTHDATPAISLMYSSAATNGILGMGWSLSGLSVISRAGRTVPQDGIKGAITFTLNDRFLLNGQRLIAYRDKNKVLLDTPQKRNAAYGLDGTEYRTEIESWVRVYSVGNCQGGPCSFVAQYKDGTTMEFAGSADAQARTTTSPAVISWAVNKVTDRNGNYVAVSYIADKTLGIVYPEKIYYSGNGRAQQVPQRLVQFAYETRPDTITQYEAGSQFTYCKRLSNISTYVDQDGDGHDLGATANLVKRYQLYYGYGASTQRSRLDSVRVCDAAGTGMPATSFAWTGTAPQAPFADTLSSLPKGFAQVLADDVGKVRADFDGDGKIDIALLQRNAKSIPILLSNTAGGFTMRYAPVPAGYAGYLHDAAIQPIAADYNGDGLSDLFFFKENATTVPILYSVGRGKFLGTTVKLPAGYNTLFNQGGVQKLVGDLNGDGRADFVGFKENAASVPVLTSQADGTLAGNLAPIPASVAKYVNAPGAQRQPGDFNGDGLLDVVILNSGYKSLPVLFSDGQLGFSAALNALPASVSTYVNANGAKQYVGDFNGDGLADLAIFLKGLKMVPLLYSRGDGTFAPQPIALGTSYQNFAGDDVQQVLGDVNGDGQTDIMAFKTALTTVPALLSSSQHHFNFVQVAVGSAVIQQLNSVGAERFVGDFNGDGLLDIAAVKRGFTRLPTLIAAKINNLNTKPELLLGINNGIGGITKARYRPITDSSIYSKSTQPLAYPLLQKQFPQYVVTHYEKVENPQQPTTALRYDLAYAGAVIDQYRGFLGFQGRRTTDYQTQSVINERYLVAFPYLGVNDRKTVRNSADTTQILGITSNAYGSQQVGTTGVYTLWNSIYELRHYTNGHYNYTRRKEFEYDAAHRSIIQINDLGNTADAADNVYSYFQLPPYQEDAATWWYSFFPLAEKERGDSTTAPTWTTWTAGDLSWRQFGYDAQRNQVADRVYRDTDGASAIGTWLRKSFAFDLYGNNTAITVASNLVSGDSVTSQVAFDGVFHTFPVLLRSVPDNRSRPLVSRYTFDPRFGLKVQETDPNGHVVLNVPDTGLDGFGRILTVQNTAPDGPNLVSAGAYRYKATARHGYEVDAFTPTTWQSTGLPDSTWQCEQTFFDGFARTINVQRTGSQAKQLISRPTRYNTQGRLARSYVPFVQPPTGSARDTFAYRNVYDSHGYLRQMLAPAADSSGQYKLTKEYLRDSLDDRIVYSKAPSPQAQTQWVYYKKVYDARGRVVEKAGPYTTPTQPGDGFGVVKFAYNAAGRLVGTTDAAAEAIAYTYNSLGELVREHSPEKGVVRYVFNANNLLVARTDSGGTTRWAYDNLNRITAKTTETKATSKSRTVTYRYDSVATALNCRGRLAQVTAENFSLLYSYDNQGNIVLKTTKLAGLKPSFAQGFGYGPANRLIASVYPDNSKLAYRYDVGGHLRSIFLNGDMVAAYGGYTTLGGIGKIGYGNGVSTQLGYDLWGRLTASTSQKGAYQHYQSSYEWSDANKLQRVADERDVAEVRLDQHFDYSLGGRVMQATGAYGTERYTYTPSGDMLSKNDLTYVYDGTKKHQLIQATQGGAVVAAYAYAGDGSLLRKALTPNGDKPTELAYGFDGSGNLGAVSSGRDTLAAFGYNGEGSRLTKKEANGVTTYYISPFYEAATLPTGKTLYTKYVHNEQGIVYSETAAAVNQGSVKPEVIRKTLRQLSAEAAQPPTRAHVPGRWLGASALALCGLGLWWQRRPAARRRCPATWRKFQWSVLMLAALLLCAPRQALAGLVPGKNGAGVPVANEKRFYHHNQVGSATFITNEQGGLTNSISYRPYGSLDAAHSTGEDNFRTKFTGKELDATIGLYYFGSRYYDAELGRFISPDPAAQYFSPYVYGDGDPLAGTDPDGQLFFEIALVVGLIVGAYVGASLAEGTFNPAHWRFDSADTWVGLITGAAAGVAVIASGGAALSAFGAVAAESVAIGTTSASTIAFTSADVAFVTSDSYKFAKEPSVVNGLFVALDVLPFAGALIGKASHGAEVLDEAAVANQEMAGAERGGETDRVAQACPMSFPKGTLVQAKEQAKAIETLAVGDEVLSWDEASASVKSFAVTRLFKRTATSLVIFAIGCCDTVRLTPEHPVYTAKSGWIEAQHLTPQTEVLVLPATFSRAPAAKPGVATYLRVGAVHFVRDTTVSVYNFEVEQAHNYFVSSRGVLVHNPTGCGATDLGGRHGQTSKSSEKFLVESNHIPASSAYEGTPYSSISYRDRPAVTMDYDDHRIAASTGSSHAAQAWRAQQTAYLNAGRFDKAMEMDIIDIKTITKNATGDRRYLAHGLEQAVRYAATYYHGGQPLITATQETHLINLIKK